MAEVLSVVEHETIPVVSSRSSGEHSITARHAGLLAKLKTLPPNAFTWGHKSIKWSQYCGLVQLGDITLEILPKVYGKESEPGACRESLVRMLKQAGLLKIHKPGGTDINLQKHTLLDIFIHDFCQQLNQQLVQGVIRRYIVREENIGVLKGKLLTQQQLRHNLAHKERLYCQYDELSEDILLNHAIKFTLRLLLPRAQSPRLKNELTQLIYAFDGVADTFVDVSDLERIGLSRNEKRFEPILRLCIIFMQALSPGTGAGDSRMFSLLFDMNKLFEHWVTAMLKPLARKNGWRLRQQGPRRFMAYNRDLDKPVFQMKPDICLLDRAGTPLLILDAKWKLLDLDEADLGVAQTDLYQMQAYGNRYSCNSLCLLYPRQMNCRGAYRYSLEGDVSHHLLVKTLSVDSFNSQEPLSEADTVFLEI